MMVVGRGRPAAVRCVAPESSPPSSMSGERDDIPAGVPAPRPSREDRLASLAARLGLELPPFPGPLVAFDPADERSPGDPVYLGGDLHAVHPETPAGPQPPRQDPSLDVATVSLTDFDHPPLETAAVDGIWCLAIEGGLLDAAPYLSISDSDGRLRTLILLPPAGSMIGLVHLWLPVVAPPRDLPGVAGGSPAS